MHSGFLNINKEKMAKSIGNFITIKQVLSKTNPQVLRFLLLSGHYRSQLEYSDALLANAKNSMDRLYQALRNLNLDTPVATCNTAKAYQSQFIQAMHDDFNTPKAIAVLFEIAKHINSLKESDLPEASSFGALLLELAHSLGLMNITAKQYFTADVDIAKIENLMLARTKARAQKDWQQSDFIRQQLAELGVLAEDKNGSSSWRKK
jgi:cysteinyl-tRNA synthetase